VGLEVSGIAVSRARFIQPCSILGQQQDTSLHTQVIFFYEAVDENRNIEASDL
jgi:hypothetical protein